MSRLSPTAGKFAVVKPSASHLDEEEIDLYLENPGMRTTVKDW